MYFLAGEGIPLSDEMPERKGSNFQRPRDQADLPRPSPPPIPIRHSAIINVSEFAKAAKSEGTFCRKHRARCKILDSCRFSLSLSLSTLKVHPSSLTAFTFVGERRGLPIAG